MKKTQNFPRKSNGVSYLLTFFLVKLWNLGVVKYGEVACWLTLKTGLEETAISIMMDDEVSFTQEKQWTRLKIEGDWIIEHKKRKGRDNL